MQEATHLPSPSLLRHLMAMVYDALLVIALIFVVSAAVLGFTFWLSGGEREVLPPVLEQLVIVVCLFGFYSAFWIKSGQTLGMQAWRIQLVSDSGGSPSVRQALLRCAGATLSLGCAGLGYLWKLVDRNDRYWHDYMSATHLVLLPRRSRNKKPKTPAGD